MARKIIVTHDGKFHADDVFAASALLLLLKNEAEVVRTRDEEKIAQADYVVDVGEVYDAKRNRFDHHQREGAGERPNNLSAAPVRAEHAGGPAVAQAGIPYAAFGLVWQHFGESIAGSREAAEMIDRALVQPLDANDNGVALFSEARHGVYPYELSDAIRALVPSWREDQGAMNQRFDEAVLFAQRILLREIEHADASISGARKVKIEYRMAEDKRLVVLNEDLPWKEALARFPEPLFVVHPQDGQWFVECVRDNPNAFINRKDLPEPWAGLRDAELAKVTGVPDAIFCHRNRFMAVVKSKEGAVALAKRALAAD